MGTKRHLVPSLTEIVLPCKEGAFLDVFSGMCTVGRAIAPHRQVWSNDLQIFSHLVATTQFCSIDNPMSRHEVPGFISQLRLVNLAARRAEFSILIEEEQAALAAGDVEALAVIFDRSLARAQALPETKAPHPAHDLFIQRYSGTYFGYEQAAEIDSIRYAIDRLKSDGRLSTDRWGALVVALCVAMAKCSNSTGHFAQALYPKKSNLKKIVSQRRRSIWTEWLDAIDGVHAVGTRDWRRGNRAFQKDALGLLGSLTEFQIKPSVIYADPPYTQDQYSRYYHIYETAVLYDYPTCQGMGLYRPNRSSSDFSLASKVEGALDSLIASVSQLRSCLVLSYPQQGLLKNSEMVIPNMIKTHFGVEPDCIRLPHRHSTMGGSKGLTSHDVTEIIYRVMV